MNRKNDTKKSYRLFGDFDSVSNGKKSPFNIYASATNIDSQQFKPGDDVGVGGQGGPVRHHKQYEQQMQQQQMQQHTPSRPQFYQQRPDKPQYSQNFQKPSNIQQSNEDFTIPTPEKGVKLF